MNKKVEITAEQARTFIDGLLDTLGGKGTAQKYWANVKNNNNTRQVIRKIQLQQPNVMLYAKESFLWKSSKEGHDYWSYIFNDCWFINGLLSIESSFDNFMSNIVKKTKTRTIHHNTFYKALREAYKTLNSDLQSKTWVNVVTAFRVNRIKDIAEGKGFMVPDQLTMKEILGTSFLFRNTPEGYHFWHEINKKLS